MVTTPSPSAIDSGSSYIRSKRVEHLRGTAKKGTICVSDNAYFKCTVKQLLDTLEKRYTIHTPYLDLYISNDDFGSKIELILCVPLK